jgi:hypothetical protein
MKNFMRIAVRWRAHVLGILPVFTLLILNFGKPESVRADDFFCASGDVTCLIAAVNSANAIAGKHVINLDPGIYTFHTFATGTRSALPLITSSIRIQPTADEPPTVIERDAAAAPIFNILTVSANGELTLSGLTIQRSNSVVSAINNFGILSLQNCVITDNIVDGGAIFNGGTLYLFKTIVSDNSSGHEAGGIRNDGTALIEFSTIAHNGADGSGGIQNRGTMVVRNSSIVFNGAGGSGAGAGIGNIGGGNLEITNSTIAKNVLGSLFGDGGGGVANLGGFVSITNSTIRENQVIEGPGGGIWNSGGTTRVENTIVAGNSFSSRFGFLAGPDCSGPIVSIGSNLFGDPSGCTVNLQPSDLTGDPVLGSLVGTEEEALPGQAYYAVLAGSPVINKGNPNACPQVDQLGNPRVGVCDIGTVEFRGPVLASVDIRPKSDANRINPNSTKNINLTIFSVNGFDATAVDPSTVRFGATGTEATPTRIAKRDVDGNGSRDVVLRFQIPDTGIKCDDTSATLSGKTFNGLSFMGSSPIKTVQCGKRR